MSLRQWSTALERQLLRQAINDALRVGFERDLLLLQGNSHSDSDSNDGFDQVGDNHSHSSGGGGGDSFGGIYSSSNESSLSGLESHDDDSILSNDSISSDDDSMLRSGEDGDDSFMSDDDSIPSMMERSYDSDQDKTSSTETSSVTSSVESDALSLDYIFGQLVFGVDERRAAIESPLEDGNIEWGRRMKICDISDSDAVAEFCFRKDHLQEVSDALWDRMGANFVGTHARIQLCNQYTAPFETCFLIFLSRMSRPRRLVPDLEKFFGMRRSHLSSAIHTFAAVFFNFAYPYLSNPAIYINKFEEYANLVSQKSGLAQRVWGFIDGTLRKTCRPFRFQKRVYSGHKRCHGLKFQSVVTPDGLIALLFGPVCGNRHDSYMLAQSQLLDQLRDLFPNEDNFYSLYGDPAYPQSRWIYGGFRNPQPNSPQAHFNTTMSKVREVVEWGFKDITTQWKYLDFKQSMKIFQSPVATYYICCAFLCNLRTCFYGNQTAAYFGAQCMNLEDYLGLVMQQ